MLPGAIAGLMLLACTAWAAGETPHGAGTQPAFPRPLESYGDAGMTGIGPVLAHRIVEEPFNLVATLIFVCAVVHTFFTSRILAISKRLRTRHEERQARGEAEKGSVHVGAGLLRFFGEIEAVFGLWCLVLAAAVAVFHDWGTFVRYVGHDTSYTEATFVVVIMALASSRPILRLAELTMWKVASRFGGMLRAWWFTILTIGPLLGSVITEPAAMTICAHLLAEKFYELEPSRKLRYATLGLLFVNISVGGTLTNFAAPPVLMVARSWGWSLGFMAAHFGWKALLSIVLANTAYYLVFRKEMARLQDRYVIVRLKRQIQREFVKRKELEEEIELTEAALNDALGYLISVDAKCEELKSQIKARAEDARRPAAIDVNQIEEAVEKRFEDIRLGTLKKTLPGLLPEGQRPPYRDPNWNRREDWVPGWVMLVHAVFMAWTVIHAHHPALFVGGFLFFLGFAQATPHLQNRIDLKPPLLVGFFLAGLVIHGGLQAWWIEPILGRLGQTSMLLGASMLTAFQDNAAITYLSTLVPDLSEGVKYAVVAGAVTGGGLTIIANAPNPAGRSILKGYFDHGVSPPALLAASLLPTAIVGLCFWLL